MSSRKYRSLRWILLVLLLLAVAVFAYVWKPAIEPMQDAPAATPDDQLLRGRNVAATGNCVVCHTAPGGEPNAGGLAMETPFGTIYSTNITPDAETGIGQWSFEAFDRAMRRGIARDGSYLYPAFPYTHFTHLSQEDMKALYAHTMSQPAVQNEPPPTRLPFPLNFRPLVAGWNLLFLDTSPIEPSADESELWNRGQYLVRGAGHCAACHSPRNAFGAEKGGSSFLAGGEAEGWISPALNNQSPSPIPWTEDALFDYLHHGFSEAHGAAGGPMAPVVRTGTSKIPDTDVRAMAVYLASLGRGTNQDASAGTAADQAAQKTPMTPPLSEGARIFASACLACHHAGEGPSLFGVRPRLALSSSLYLDEPVNLIRYVLDGVQDPAHPDLGYMPGFRYSLSNQQIATLANYMRTELAGQQAWGNLPEEVARIRGEPSAH